MNKNLKRGIWILVGLIIAYFIISPKLNGKSDTKLSQSKAKGPLLVNAIVLKEDSLKNSLKTIGSLMAFEEVELSTEASGRVEQILFQEGSFVKKGQLLLKIYNADLQAQLLKAQSRFNLSKDMERRAEAMLKKEGISQAEFDMAKNESTAAKAEIMILEDQIRKTQIFAPFDGTIGLRSISEGALVNPATKIASLQNVSKLKIEFSIPEKYASSVKIGNSIKYKIDGNSKLYKAKVYAIEPKVNLNTRNITLRAISDNNDFLIPGVFASIEIDLATVPNAITVPTEAVVPQMKGQILFLAKGDSAVAAPITLGNRGNKDIQVLSGVQAGDTVITSGILQLRPGAKVKLNLSK